MSFVYQAELQVYSSTLIGQEAVAYSDAEEKGKQCFWLLLILLINNWPGLLDEGRQTDGAQPHSNFMLVITMTYVQCIVNVQLSFCPTHVPLVYTLLRVSSSYFLGLLLELLLRNVLQLLNVSFGELAVVMYSLNRPLLLSHWRIQLLWVKLLKYSCLVLNCSFVIVLGCIGV